MEEMVVTSEKASTSFPASTVTRMICRVCEKQFSKYTCPRCSSPYCSLECYKSHSLRCTESFMRENVVGEMGQIQPDDEIKQKMIDILKRFHSEEVDSMDEEDNNDTILREETIQKILSGNEITLDDLSDMERKQFERAITSGEVSKLIEPWEPWWLKSGAKSISLSSEGTQLIQPLYHEESSSTEIPPGPETPLLSITKLTSTRPSPLLIVHLVDILYSYCFTLRLYNGDWQSEPLDAAMVILNLSNVLGEGGHPESVSQAVMYSLEQTCSPAYRHTGGLRFGLGLLDDVVSVLNLGGAGLVCSLCDLHRLMQAGEKEIQSNKERKVKSKVKLAVRKVYFMMCWVHEQASEGWYSLAALVNVEKKSIAALDLEGGRKRVQSKAKESKGKIVIEEIE
ncbi:hypothetical protein ACHQM5_024935 [Ranunculus cassubicifolius]